MATVSKVFEYSWFTSRIPDCRALLSGLVMCLVMACGIQAASPSDNDKNKGAGVLEQTISLPRQSATTYDVLNQISRLTGMYFVYDSDLIDNDRRVRLQRSSRPVREYLMEILDDPALDYLVMEQHILIFRPGEEQEATAVAGQEAEAQPPAPEYFTIQGRVLEADNGNPLPYASVSIPGKGKGIASNMEGWFSLRLPAELLDTVVRFSYMGYRAREMPLSLLTGRSVDVMLETDYISMQEVIIRYYDPDVIVREALAKRHENFSREPVYLTSFYREGVQRNSKLMRYSEAVIKVYKPAYTSITDEDQVKLLKSRTITNIEAADSLELKLEAGVGSSLELDFMRNIPDFLDPETMGQYHFVKADIVSYNSRSTYAIEFRQRDNIRQALFMGVLYVDTKTLAFVGAEFEVNPRYVNYEQHLFIRRRSRDYVANIQRIGYSVRYQLFEGRYILEHVRGEIRLKFRHRGKVFNNNYLAFFEHAVCHIETQDVRRFQRRETMNTQTVFSDKNLEYDFGFWGNYNFISPEKEVSEGLAEIRAKIESMVSD